MNGHIHVVHVVQLRAAASIFLLLALIRVPSAAQVPSDGVFEAPLAERNARWLPETCVLAVDEGRAFADRSEGPEARWNHHYRLGVEAIGSEDLDAAETYFCRALQAARAFDPRDVRFAETLDELGLVGYLKGDDATAEKMQGAAVAEMLLATGPPTEDLRTTAEKSCRSSVAVYLVRLGWIYERQERKNVEIDVLLDQPYRIFALGYLPAGSLLGRLDWLIGQYLLAEDFAAADWLSALRDELRQVGYDRPIRR